MKKILLTVLALIIAISSFSCSRNELISSESETATKETESEIKTNEGDKEIAPLHDVSGKFAVGYKLLDITPYPGCPLGGWPTAGTRISKTILDRIYITFVAFQDEGGNRALLITVDSLGINTEVANLLMNAYAKSGNLPVENIIISATHTHSAPALDCQSNPAIAQYTTDLVRNGKKAVEEAFANLDEAEIYVSSKDTVGLTFVRRYIDANGKPINRTELTPGSKHETEADNEMQVIKFVRKNEKDVAIVNWQSHPCMHGTEKGTEISGDYIHYFRKAATKKNDVEFAFYEGAAGNLEPRGYAQGDNSFFNEQFKEYGEKLAEEFTSVLNGDMEKVNAGLIKSKVSELTAIYKEDKIEGGQTTKNIKIYVFGFGDIAFIAAPYEMFSQTGQTIKNASPFKMTFVCEQANGKNSYFASSDVFDNGGYEPGAGYFVKGTAEAFQNEFIKMLGEIH